MDETLIEAMARAMCKCNGTAQCAAICLSYSATTTRNGKCPEAVRVHGRDARACAPLAFKAGMERAAEIIKSSEGDIDFAVFQLAAAIRKAAE